MKVGLLPCAIIDPNMTLPSGALAAMRAPSTSVALEGTRSDRPSLICRSGSSEIKAVCYSGTTSTRLDREGEQTYACGIVGRRCSPSTASNRRQRHRYS